MKALLKDTRKWTALLTASHKTRFQVPYKRCIFFKDTKTLRLYKLDASFVFKLENKAERKDTQNEILLPLNLTFFHIAVCHNELNISFRDLFFFSHTNPVKLQNRSITTSSAIRTTVSPNSIFFAQLLHH